MSKLKIIFFALLVFGLISGTAFAQRRFGCADKACLDAGRLLRHAEFG